MNTHKRPMADCHPDRPHWAKGLCKKCYNNKYAQAHSKVNNARSKQWAKDNPEKIKIIKRRYLYGIEPEVVQAKFNAQDGLCKICQINPAIHLDHNHKTREPRSLLCGDCNRGLGLFKEDPIRLQTAINYLELWN